MNANTKPNGGESETNIEVPEERSVTDSFTNYDIDCERCDYSGPMKVVNAGLSRRSSWSNKAEKVCPGCGRGSE